MLLDRQPGRNENINYHLCIFHILQFILDSETWGNKKKEMYYSLLSLKISCICVLLTVGFLFIPPNLATKYEFK